MKKLVIILDPAHGEEVAGKRSPDGLFREYKWSREVLKELKYKLKQKGYEVFETNASDREIGLTKRADNANKIQRKNKLVISLHSNAASNGQWSNARGYSIYTTKGQTKSDEYAQIFLEELKRAFPEIKGRFDLSDGDLDMEENFTILQKTTCPAILIEWLFQDNKEDVKLLMDQATNSKLVDTLIIAIDKIDNNL